MIMLLRGRVGRLPVMIMT